MQSEGHCGDIVPLDIMLWGFVTGDVCALEEGPYLGLELVVELVVLGLVVARAPVVQVTVDAVLNLDMHERSNNFINVTNPPSAYSRPPHPRTLTMFSSLMHHRNITSYPPFSPIFLYLWRGMFESC